MITSSDYKVADISLAPWGRRHGGRLWWCNHQINQHPSQVHQCTVWRPIQPKKL